MISDYERGRRTYSDDMAKRLSKTLKVKEEHLKYESKSDDPSAIGWSSPIVGTSAGD